MKIEKKKKGNVVFCSWKPLSAYLRGFLNRKLREVEEGKRVTVVTMLTQGSFPCYMYLCEWHSCCFQLAAESLVVNFNFQVAVDAQIGSLRTIPTDGPIWWNGPLWFALQYCDPPPLLSLSHTIAGVRVSLCEKKKPKSRKEQIH